MDVKQLNRSPGPLPFLILIELIDQPEAFQMGQEPIRFCAPARLIGEHRVETGDHLSRRRRR